MKIQLQQHLKSHPHQLHCVACERSFLAARLRILLCHDRDSIVGDLCVQCIQQGTNHIQQLLKQRSIELFKCLLSDSSPSPHQKALVLWELAAQPLTIPAFYHWWWQKLTIIASSMRSLELVHPEPLSFHSRQQKPHKIIFFTKKPSRGKDS